MQQHPKVKLSLCPITSEGQAIAIRCHLRIQEPLALPHIPILELPLISHGVPTQQYEALKAWDNAGELSLDLTKSSKAISWAPQRATSGDVTVEFSALPRKVTKDTPVRARVDLRQNYGGLLGCGSTFIPVIQSHEDVESEYTVDWDLTNVPDDWRGVWTFSTTDSASVRRDDRMLLQETFYAVGKVSSIESSDGIFGIYWFGDLPDPVMTAAKASETLFRYLSDFFEQGSVAKDPYKIFIRNAWPARGFGGGAFRRCYCLEYDSAINIIDIEDIKQLLAHEMIHNWPLMGSLTDSDYEQFKTAWFNEGIANLYSVLLPYRAGTTTGAQFLVQMNAELSSYYTHPYRAYSIEQLAKLGFNDVYGTTLDYYRGSAYLLHVLLQLHQANHPPSTFDSIIRSFLPTSNEPRNINQWLSQLNTLLGDNASKQFHAMTQGSVIDFSDISSPQLSSINLVLTQEEREIYDLCMDPNSFNTRVIHGLKSGSRAAEAGLRNGDVIVSNSFSWVCEVHFRATMHVTIDRDGEMLDFEYWPRTWEKVKVWQFEEL